MIEVVHNTHRASTERYVKRSYCPPTLTHAKIGKKHTTMGIIGELSRRIRISTSIVLSATSYFFRREFLSTMLSSNIVPVASHLHYFHKAFVHVRNSQLTKYKIRLPCVRANPQRLTSIRRSHCQFSTMSRALNASVEYHWIDGAERLDPYEPGGYLPVMVDDLLHNRYRIADKLGFGGYSTVWLAQDEKRKRFVAVKIEIASPSTARRETEILQTLHGSSRAHKLVSVTMHATHYRKFTIHSMFVDPMEPMRATR